MKKNILSFIGIGVGSAALILALMHFWAGPFSPQPSLESVVAEKAVGIRDATVAALRGEKIKTEASTVKFTLDKLINIITALLGSAAIILGVTGVARKETIHAAGGAMFLGVGAIAFQFAAMALGVLVVTILIAVVLSQIGFG